MQRFQIKDIENLTGIKAHTWHIWKQRYPRLLPNWETGNARNYDARDINIMLQITFLYHNSWKISRIARLSARQLTDEVNNIVLDERTIQNSLWLLLEAAVNFDERIFDQLLDQVMNKIGFERCITEVCYPFLQRIGLLWVTNKVPPAQDHFSTLRIQNIIIAETEKLDKYSHPLDLILFAPPGSSNELPLLYLNYLLRKMKWGVIYLGSNVQMNTLHQFSGNEDIQYLFLHKSADPDYFDADHYLEDLCRSFPGKKVIASGSMIRHVQRTFTNLTLLKSDKEIVEFIVNRR